MTVKQFEATSMPEALRLVRADLGDGAMILETRRTRRGLFGMLGLREQFHVKASVDSAADTAVDRCMSAIATAARPGSLRPTAARTPASVFLDRMLESGVTEDLARRWLNACGTAPSEAALARTIARNIPVAPGPSGGPARIALVGPTGVGKTTTTAKLAARYALTERRKVGLVTIDTYRIGAVEQLRTYARVMGLPLDVVQSPDEMPAALARHADKDVVLIDTVGRSPRRALHLAEIQAYLNVAEPTETHLVVSASSGTAYLHETAELFACLGTNRLIVTKLDEMPRWGVIAGLAVRAGLPVSYITDGQEVPRNLRPASADEIAVRMLGGME